MTTFVLIQAGEGNTGSIYVANGSREDLIETILKTIGTTLSYGKNDWVESNREYIEKERDSLVSMVREHQDWTPGRHTLKNIEPHWQEWTLIITEDQFGDFL